MNKVLSHFSQLRIMMSQRGRDGWTDGGWREGGKVKKRERQQEHKKLALVNVSNSFKDCGSKREWRNGELIAGRNEPREGFYDHVLIC